MSTPAPGAPAAPAAAAPRRTAAEQAVQALTRAIREGRYGPGERLVESQLTRELGVSRGTVREALRRLAAEGLIETESHRGAIVRRITREEVADILIVREVLEGLAAQLAAARIDDGARRRVREMREYVRSIRSGETRVDYLEDNLAFHQFVIELAGNRPLGQQIRQLQLPAVRKRFFAIMSTDDWQRSLGEHELILQAILDGDPQLADQLMRAHIRRTRHVFEKLPDEAFGPPVDVEQPV